MIRGLGLTQHALQLFHLLSSVQFRNRQTREVSTSLKKKGKKSPQQQVCEGRRVIRINADARSAIPGAVRWKCTSGTRKTCKTKVQENACTKCMHGISLVIFGWRGFSYQIAMRSFGYSSFSMQPR